MADTSDLLRVVERRELEPFKGRITPYQRAILDVINQKVAAAESLASVMSFVFETSRGIFPCDRLGIAFVEEKGRRVVSRWVMADYKPVLLKEGYAEGLGGSSLGELVRTGHPRIIRDLEKYGDRKPKSRSTRILVEEGVRSSLTCPLFVDGRAVGLLFRSSRKPDAYGTPEVALHSMLAERLGQAVEKAWRIDQLSAANRGYMELLAFASHEIRSPLAGLVMNGELLLGGYFGPLTERQKEKISGMLRKAGDLLSLTKEYLDLSRSELGSLTAKIQPAVRLREAVVEPALHLLSTEIESRKAKVSVDPAEGDERVDCDPELMKTAVTNLISNALRYGREGGAIKVRLRSAGGECRVAVWNEGAGFAREERERLFKRFSRIPAGDFKHIKGTGVGLYLVWQIAELHRGKVFADSEPGQWAEFGFEVPVLSERE